MYYRRLSVTLGLFTLAVTVFTFYKFLSLLFVGSKEPGTVITGEPSKRMFLNFLLVMQFFISHSVLKLKFIQDIFTRGNYLANAYSVFYSMASSMSLYVCSSCLL